MGAGHCLPGYPRQPGRNQATDARERVCVIHARELTKDMNFGLTIQSRQQKPIHRRQGNTCGHGHASGRRRLRPKRQSI